MILDAGIQAFSEESRELLENMEDTLLQLEANPDDDDLINELFRAVHTIKGSAGLFSFDHVVEFAHLAESVMGRIRDRELTADREILTLLLESRDHLVVLVDRVLQGNNDLDGETASTGEKLSARLQHYLGDAPALHAESPDIAALPEPELPKSKALGVENGCWHLSLRFGKDVLCNGMDPLSFIRYLETVGDIVNLTTLDHDLPEPDNMEPESCYLGFEIDLNSAAQKEEIESVFEFVQDDCIIHILPPHSQVSRYIQLIDELPEENYRIGEILTASGALTQRELGEILAKQLEEPAVTLETEMRPKPVFGEVAVFANERFNAVGSCGVLRPRSPGRARDLWARRRRPV